MTDLALDASPTNEYTPPCEAGGRVSLRVGSLRSRQFALEPLYLPQHPGRSCGSFASCGPVAVDQVGNPRGAADSVSRTRRAFTRGGPPMT